MHAIGVPDRLHDVSERRLQPKGRGVSQRRPEVAKSQAWADDGQETPKKKPKKRGKTNTPASTRTERHTPKGWRCMSCHPPVHLAGEGEIVGGSS